jgi:hypothetical protein
LLEAMTLWVFVLLAGIVAWLMWRKVLRTVWMVTRVAAGTAGTIRKARTHAARLAALPMPDFLAQWSALTAQLPDGATPTLRPPASAADIDATERTLGFALPAELREFYQHADGIDWSKADYRRDLVAVAQLTLAAHHAPSLATQARAMWEAHGRDADDPEGLAVLPADALLDTLVGANEFVLPFADVDAMLALEVPSEGCGIVMVCAGHPRLPVGTVLEVENGCATRYDGLKAWLANDAASLHAITAGARVPA